MFLADLIAAHANEGVHREMLRRYLPNSASQELDLIHDKFGPHLYREIMWEERARDAVQPPIRSSIAWPIKRVVHKVIPFRSRMVNEPACEMNPPGFWSA